MNRYEDSATAGERRCQGGQFRWASIDAGPGFWSRLVALPVLALAITLLAPSAAVGNGSPNIALEKSTPAKVLYGGTAGVELKASNPLLQPTGYNLSFRDVLPAGVSYKPNSAGPLVGEPLILDDQPGANLTTLLWSNVSDLTPGSDFSLTYEVDHDANVLDVPDPYTNNAGAYINCDPRFVPDFDASGNPVQTTGNDCTGASPDPSYTGFATALATTEISPIKVSKTSPDEQILRGIHDHVGAYAIEVENNLINPSNNVEVVDYLEAGIEFVGCGGPDIDNTSDAPTNPGASPVEEYPGSGAIAEPALAGCVEPATVETVELAAGNPQGLDAGVYTKLTWDALPDLAPGDTITLPYLAGIPIRENTMDWNGAAAGLGDAPAAGGPQGANLDNNSGEETAEELGAAAREYTNTVIATADYDPPDAPATEVSDSGEATVAPQDLRISKSGSPTNFTSGQISEWELTIETGEYRYVDSLVVTDTLGDGYCPLGSTNLEGPAGTPDQSAECDSTGSDNPSAPYTSATEDADGTWEIVWDESTDAALARIQPSSSHTITFPTRTRDSYQENFTDESPILANDVGTNSVDLVGDDFIICAPGAPDAGAPGCSGAGASKISADEDDGTPDGHTAEAGQAAPSPSIEKTVNDTANPYSLGSCESVGSFGKTPPTANPGDDVCFKLRMDFPANVDTGAVTVTDFIPPGTTYLAGSTELTADNTATISSGSPPEPDVDNDVLSWPLGTEPDGTVFEVTFAVEVNRAPTSSDGDITDNLMKVVYSNTKGASFPLRDSASFRLEAPSLSLLKGVGDINDVPGDTGADPANGRFANDDGGIVAGGDVVTYRVDVTNDGSVVAEKTEVWDRLPPEVGCGEVSAISDGGACDNGATPLDPSDDVIKWGGDPTALLPDIAAGATLTLTYDVTIPAGLTGGDELVNTAGVRQYESRTGSGPDPFVSIPQFNIDPDQNPSANAPAAINPSNVEIEGPTIAKTAETELDEDGNNKNSEATIGEQILYTVTVTIPEGTSLYGDDAAIIDELGNRKTLVAGTADATIDLDGPGAGAPDTLPAAGLTLTESVVDNTVRIDFPNPYDNPSGSGDDVIVLTFAATVDDDWPENQVDGVLTNDVALKYQNQAGDDLEQGASVETTIVEPRVSIAKSSNGGAVLSPGENVTFTLTVANAAGASVAHDNVIVDTLPDGFSPVNGADPGTPVADNGAVNPDGGIWNETTRTITWDGATTSALAAIEGGDANAVSVTYKVIVDSGPIAGSTVKNTAGVATTSVPGADDGERDGTSDSPRYSAGVELPSELVNAAIEKETTPSKGTVGELMTHKLTVSIPANVRLFDATVVDDVPDGLIFREYVSAGCPTGCTGGGTDINPTTLTPTPSGSDTRIGWFLGDLGIAPQVRTVELVYTTNIAATYGAGTVGDGDQFENTATLAFNESDQITAVPQSPPNPDDFDTTTSDTSTVDVGEPGIAIDKDVSGQNADDDVRDTQPGDDYTFTLAVTNTGTAPAYDVVVTDEPDSALENVQLATGDSTDLNDDPWTAADPAMQWTIPGPIAVGATVTLTYTADLVGGGSLTDGQQITNTADVAEFWGVPVTTREDAANGAVDYRRYVDVDEDTVVMTVDKFDADIGVSKTANDSSPIAGTETTWTIEVTNNGPETAPDVQLTDQVPVGLTYVDATPDQGSCSVSAGVLECDLGAIANGETVTVVLTTLVGADQAGETLTNTAAVSDPSITDTNPGNDADEDVVEPVGLADVAVTKDLLTDLRPGVVGTYELTVTNAGPSVAENVQLVDTLPPGFGFRESRPSGCVATDRIVKCSLGDLAPGAVEVIEIDVDVTGGGLATNRVEVGSDTEDPDQSNNTDERTDLAGNADLSIDKTGPAAFVTGKIRSYTLLVTNESTDVSSVGTVTVTDEVPEGLEIVRVLGAGWDCGFVDRLVTCTRDDSLAPGESFPLITIRARLLEGVEFTLIENTGRVDIEGDLNLDNNEDTVETPAGPQDDVLDDSINGICADGSLSLTPAKIWVGEQRKVTALVETADGNAAVGVPVVLRGRGGAKGSSEVDKTNKRGRAVFQVRAKSRTDRWVASVRQCDLKAKLRAMRQESCRTMKVTPRSVRVGKRTRIRVSLSSPGGRVLSRVKVKVRGLGTSDQARTNRRGKVALSIRPRQAGLMTVRAPKATTCTVELGATDPERDGGQLTG